MYHSSTVSGQEVTPAPTEAAKWQEDDLDADSLDRNESLYVLMFERLAIGLRKFIPGPSTLCLEKKSGGNGLATRTIHKVLRDIKSV